MAIRFTKTSRGRCVCGRLRSTTTRETDSISMSDVVKEPHQTYIYTQKEPPVNYTIEWLHEKGYVQRIYTCEKYIWILTFIYGDKPKNIHDGTTQSTTEIGKYNHRQFTHRCSTSRSSQAGRWSQEARPQTKSRRQPGLGTLSSASSLPSHAPQDFARLQLSMSWSASGADYVLSP